MHWLPNAPVQCQAMSVYLSQTLVGITNKNSFMVRSCVDHSIGRGLIIKHLLVHHVSLLPMLLLPQLLTMKPMFFVIGLGQVSRQATALKRGIGGPLHPVPWMQ